MSLATLLVLLAPQAELIELNADAPVGVTDGTPRELASLPGVVVGASNDPELGREPFAFDGTTAVTLVDAAPGDASSFPAGFRAAGGWIWFSAFAPETGRELWRTDGTPAGTALVADLLPGAADSGDPAEFVALGGLVLFAADTPTGGRGLWRTDGSPAGTWPLISFSDGAEPPLVNGPEGLARVGDLVFFGRDNGAGLWRSDGTTAGTFEITPPNFFGVYEIVDFAGQAYFRGWTPATESELWRSDGVGYELVLDLLPSGSGSPAYLTVFAGELYFVGRTPGNSRALFKTDGTSGVATLIADPNQNGGGFGPRELTAAATWLGFVADDGVHGAELWRSDGTAAGTMMVEDVVTTFGDFDPELLTAVGDRIVFRGQVVGDREPWASDGVDVYPLGNLYLASDSYPAEFHSDGAEIFFEARSDAVGRELWRTDASAPGTVLAANLAAEPSSAGSDPSDFVRVGPRALFAASGGGFGRELWVTDGSAPGTLRLADIAPGAGDADPVDFATLGDEVYFIATMIPAVIPRREIWKSDGTVAGTVQVTELWFEETTRIEDLVAAGGRLWFAGSDLQFVGGTVGLEPFSSDGTAAGTVALGDLCQNPSAVDSFPTDFTAAGDRVVFSARVDDLTRRLFRSDGTEAGTEVIDGDPGDPLTFPRSFATLSSGLALFVADTAGEGAEPWATDGTAAGTVRLADVAPGAAGSDPSDFLVGSSRALFVAESPATGREVWVTDGSLAATSLLVESAPGPADLEPVLLGTAGDRFVFATFDGVATALWASDGTSVGTASIADFGVAAIATDPAPRAAGDLLYFATEAQADLRTLWRTDGTAAGTVAVTVPAHGAEFDDLAPAGGGDELVFAASTDGGREVWRSRGTLATTGPIAELLPGAGGSEPEGFLRAGGSVVFSARTHDTGRELASMPFGLTDGWSMAPFGVGCPGTGGVTPAIGAEGAARLGDSLAVTVGAAFGPSSAFLLEAPAYGPLPLGPCTIYPAVPVKTLGVTAVDLAGTGSVPFDLPAVAPGLTGVPLWMQYAVIDPGGAFADLVSFSDVLEVVIGPPQ